MELHALEKQIHRNLPAFQFTWCKIHGRYPVLMTNHLRSASATYSHGSLPDMFENKEA